MYLRLGASGGCEAYSNDMLSAAGQWNYKWETFVNGRSFFIDFKY